MAKENTQFKKGYDSRRNLKGRKVETKEQKLVRKVQKEFVKEYKESLASILPKLSPVLIEKALGGDIQAIKEIHSIVVGEAPKHIDLTSQGEKIKTITKITINQPNGATSKPHDKTTQGLASS